MNKLKTQNFNNLLNYQHFLKNNSLKKKRFKLKNIIFENPILYKNQNLDIDIIELENSENIQIPVTVLDFKSTATIEASFEKQLLFNYNLNYNILYNFNKIMFNYFKNNNKKIIKGRLVGKVKSYKKKNNNKKVLIAILGRVFSMKSIKLNDLIKKKRKLFYVSKNKKFKGHNFLTRYDNITVHQIIKSYTLRCLNFKILKNKKKKKFSRTSYVKYLLKYLRIKNLKKRMILERNKKNKIKKILSKKGYAKKQKKQK